MSNKTDTEDKIKIVIAEDFSDAVGARDREDGDFSGEEFYEKHLKSAFERAIKEEKKVWIDFDNTWGYPSSFISSAFGRLSDHFGENVVINHLEMKSEGDGSLEYEVNQAIKEGNK